MEKSSGEDDIVKTHKAMVEKDKIIASMREQMEQLVKKSLEQENTIREIRKVNDQLMDALKKYHAELQELKHNTKFSSVPDSVGRSKLTTVPATETSYKTKSLPAQDSAGATKSPPAPSSEKPINAKSPQTQTFECEKMEEEAPIEDDFILASRRGAKRPHPRQDDSEPKKQTRSYTQSQSQDQASSQKDVPRTKIPPIVLRDKSKYNQLTAKFKELKLDFGRALTVPEGVKIHPATINDFRCITKLLDTNGEQYHTYQLPEDKHMHVIFRGILETLTEAEIKEDLEEKNFSPYKIIRWHYRSGDPMPMVLALLPKSDKAIFQIKEIKHNVVRVETQRSKQMATQCHNCQLYGHASLNCKADPKCVKCGEDHHWSKCSKSNEAPAKCANCKGPHPSSFKGCPCHPKHKAAAAAAPTTVPAPAPNFKWGSQKNSLLQSQVIPEAAPPEMLNTLNDINSAMQLFFSTLQQQFASILMPLLSKAASPR